jgi:pimeloyl-ACP methyl ester carboxylesterase
MASFRLRAIVLVLTALAIAPCGAAPSAARAGALHEGTHQGAEYLIGMPERWNGGLVMFAHGYEGEGSGRGSVRGSPLGAQLDVRGYAWAASGYRSKGYRPDWFMDDLLALRALFITRFGAPRWTVLHGQSMGGHVTIASLELHPEVYQGALVECGIVDGVGLVDWLYAYTAAAEYLSGVKLLDAPGRQAFSALVNGPWLDAMGTPGSFTDRGRRFDSVVKHLMGGDLPLRAQGMPQRYLMNLNSRDPGPDRAQEFARHASTTHIRYRIDPGLGVTDDELNRGVRRIAPAPGARSRDANPVFAEPTGRIRVPVLTIHETADFRVPFRTEQDYRRRTEKVGTSHLLVQRAVRWPGHCGIDNAARRPAFDDLVAWIEKGAVPEGDDVLGDVSRLGLRWTPLRHPKDQAARQ